MHKLKDINGNEIIKFLNEISSKENKRWGDVSIRRPFVFESQKVISDFYQLRFTGYFNNWGTDQAIYGNEIKIDKKGKVTVFLDEPFEGDGSDEVLKEILTNWLKTHKFDNNPEKNFYELIQSSIDKLCCIQYSEPDSLQEIIDKLTEAKTYIK